MATVLDLLDTQMMDYPSDIDVQMQPSMEPWFQDEAAMQEESQYSFTRSSTDGDLVDVEIDMENYDTQETQNPEYEMIEAEDYPVATEVEDVMLADALHTAPAPAPDSVDASTVSVPPPAEVFPPAHTSSSVEELPAVMSVTTPLPQAHVQLEEVQEAPSGVALPSELPDTTDSYPDQFEEVNLASSTALDEVAASLPAGSDDHEPIASTASDAIHASSDEVPSHLEGDTHEDTNYPATVLTAESTDSTSVAESNVSSTVSAHDGGAVEQTETEASDPQPEPVQESTDIARSAEDVVPSEAHEQGDDLNQETDLVDTTRDPHEISEGVYIDPPPAVLLSFAFMDHPDVCLFNQPTHSDPSSSTTEIPSYSLLLHDCPTLYYEPLSAVFEALRNDGYLSSIADLSHLELVLDAYDLQLPVSEDNIFAREISLHDLNVLHDGSDISGPLRLRLKTVNPRFIIRYRMLQDQIIRLALAEEDDNSEDIEGQGHDHEYAESHPESSELQGQDQDGSTDSLEVRQDGYEAQDSSPEAAEQSEQLHGEVSALEEGDAKQEESHQDKEVTENDFIEDAYDAVDEIPENVADGDDKDGGDKDGGDKDDDSNNPPFEGEEVLTSEQNLSVIQVPEDSADQASPLVEPREIENHEGEENEFDDAQTTTNAEVQEDSSNSLDYQDSDAAANEVDSLTVPESTVNIKGDDTSDKDHASEQENQDETLYYDEDYEESWEDGVYEEDEEGANTALDVEADPDPETASIESSVTLSSKNSKRSIHDVDPEDADEALALANSSPGSKRIRTG